jgi:hypothetical protein
MRISEGATCDLGRRQAPVQAHRERRERIHRVVLARKLEFELHQLPVRARGHDLHVGVLLARDQPDVARRVTAEGDHPEIASTEFTERLHQRRVVAVRDHRRAGRETVGDARLLGRDRLERAHAAQVRTADHGDHRRILFGDRREPADLARMVHAHLEQQEVIAGHCRQHRERHADLVVEALRAAGAPLLLRQHAVEQAPRRGLAARTGDADRERRNLGTPGGGELLQRDQRVAHEQRGDRWREPIGKARHDQ